ncbi:FMN-linked oxidoreductase [Stipitochalara longipes BDJ]|nr:FMN-linked oxidoreductase [Stipitochalara longipes BDJ]
MNIRSKFSISPPLLNSSNPWATSKEDLVALYSCPHTGAVTIRTSLWKAFAQHASTHQYTFFSSSNGHATTPIDITFPEGRGGVRDGETSSLNTLGYSPIAFEQYVELLVRMSQYGMLSLTSSSGPKPFIVSVTGTADEVAKCCEHLIKVLNDPDAIYPHPAGTRSAGLNLMMEINLSCPNIPDKPPPAYDGAALTEYIDAIAKAKSSTPQSYKKVLYVGIKTPPYTFHGQFKTLISALETSSISCSNGCPISFITATNTLGSCLVLDSHVNPALGSVTGEGIGGMAGDALHPLALGNVKTIRGLLDQSAHEDVRSISIIGIGGVKDADGFRRMKSVGAEAVGVGTALGREGVGIFGKIAAGLEKH